MKYVFLVGFLALLMVTTAMAEDTLIPLFDFTEADAAKQWQAVNDGVMGGVSEGKFKITDAKTMEFFGTLSLANCQGGWTHHVYHRHGQSCEKCGTVIRSMCLTPSKRATYFCPKCQGRDA